MLRNNLLLFICLLMLAGGCREKRQHPTQGMSNEEMREMLMESSRYAAQREDAEIDEFIKKQDLELQTSGTGLRYLVYSAQPEPCDSIESEQRVWLNYKVSLLDGKVCYSSQKDEPRSFTVDHDDVESGLHEAVKYMCEGDSGYFILPSHLAHGLTGDQQKIPSNSPIIYEIEIVKVQ